MVSDQLPRCSWPADIFATEINSLGVSLAHLSEAHKAEANCRMIKLFMAAHAAPSSVQKWCPAMTVLRWRFYLALAISDDQKMMILKNHGNLWLGDVVLCTSGAVIILLMGVWWEYYLFLGGSQWLSPTGCYMENSDFSLQELRIQGPLSGKLWSLLVILGFCEDAWKLPMWSVESCWRSAVDEL